MQVFDLIHSNCSSLPIEEKEFGGNELNFSVQTAEQPNWCWAAVSVSIAVFYDPKSLWKQCLLANKLLVQTTCCQDGSSNECDEPWYLGKALDEIGLLDNMVSEAVSFKVIEEQINQGKVICAAITWNVSHGGTHFVAISGYGDNENLIIKDPVFGAAQLDYNTFKTKYKKLGKWTYTYLTKYIKGVCNGATFSKST